MNRAIFSIAILVGILVIAMGLLPPRHDSDFDVQGFATMPVQTGGRIMPLDSVAINSLRMISGRSAVRLPEGGRLSAIAWFLEVSLRPTSADAIPVFRIDNAEVLGLFGWPQEERKFFSFNELRPHFATIEHESHKVAPEAQQRTVFERQIIKLSNALTLYHQLTHSLIPPSADTIPSLEYMNWESATAAAFATVRQMEAEGSPLNEQALARFSAFLESYQRLAQISRIGIVPPREGIQRDEDKWANLGEGLLETPTTGTIDPVLAAYAELAEAWRIDDAAAFNATIDRLHSMLDPESNLFRVHFEEFFNTSEPFYRAAILYVLIFLLAAAGWLGRAEPFHRAAGWLLLLAFVVHTFGLLARMYIQERPPVTNLYSSAIFVGWGAVLLGLIIERFNRNGLGAAVAAICGFCTLIIAHNLAMTGDTLEMMRAVLDSNFWLATHVIVITIGYSGVFVAGIIGALFLILRLLPQGLDRSRADGMVRMAYGTTCFALLMSFVGTMLGGIWADQSWGRFWGWDPKENGALLIVLWGAIMLHARWAKIVAGPGFMCLAVFGNIITAWSWFGTNMLGVGLHSYGFMDSAFMWLALFCISQLMIMALVFVPTNGLNATKAGQNKVSPHPSPHE